jgi:hypothetical protein
MPSATILEFSAIMTMLSVTLSLVGVVARFAYRALKAVDGHLDALRANTAATAALSERMDKLESRSRIWH